MNHTLLFNTSQDLENQAKTLKEYCYSHCYGKGHINQDDLQEQISSVEESIKLLKKGLNL